MSAPHTPVQPARDTFDGAELGAYDHVVERQLAYDYPAFLAMVPAEHQRAFQNATLNPAGAEADPRHRVQPYMGAMLNNNHEVSGIWLVLLIVAVFFDLGGQGHSARSGRVRYRRA